jgi:glutamate formiminotransferase
VKDIDNIVLEYLKPGDYEQMVEAMMEAYPEITPSAPIPKAGIFCMGLRYSYGLSSGD